MISFLSILALAATAYAINPTVDNFYNMEATCTERCPEGFEYVESVGRCYKLLLELGPVSQDRGVIACAMNNGSTLPIFENMDQIQNVREYFYDQYGKYLDNYTPDNVDGSQAWTPQAGFWTGWVRQAGDGVVSDNHFLNDYVNMYNGVAMPGGLWAKGQPNDDNLDQSCVARKRFYKEFVQKGADNGLDDYQCSYPHWVVCATQNVYALNKRAYNVKMMAEKYSTVMEGDEPSPAGADDSCELDWPTQSKYQFAMMIEYATNNQAHKEVAAYQACQTPITDSKPDFDKICLPTFNYKCD